MCTPPPPTSPGLGLSGLRPRSDSSLDESPARLGGPRRGDDIGDGDREGRGDGRGEGRGDLLGARVPLGLSGVGVLSSPPSPSPSPSAFNASSLSSCHLTILGSASVGKASAGSGAGNGAPVSGCLRAQFCTACWRRGTCEVGPRRISTAAQRTKPRGVRAGIEGGRKSFAQGWRVCWQPMLLQM